MEVDRRGITARQLRSLFLEGTTIGLTDGQLLEQFSNLAGESSELAFAALVERHGPMVHRVCRRMLGVQDADDAFQATFLVLARRAGAIRRRDSVGPWLFGVALRVAACDRAARDRRRAQERRVGQQRLGLEAGRFHQPEDRSELARVVLEEVGRLPERYRAVVVLCDLEGLGHEEAARLLGCPVGTIKSRQARGRDRLRGRLARRGLEPSATLPASLFPEAAGAAVPTGLAESTARFILATGVVPVAVEALAEGVRKAMFLAKLKLLGALAILTGGLIATGSAVSARQGVGPRPAAAPTAPDAPILVEAGAGLLNVTGTVFLPDGSPAAGATLASSAGEEGGSIVARSDEAGRFRLRGLFENAGRLHASSADGSHQAILRVSADSARLAFGHPVELRLAPASALEVAVDSGLKPVEGARVAAVGPDFKVRGVTGLDGKVRLLMPAEARLTELVAWHPERGVNGLRNLEKGLPRETALLSLLPPKAHAIRVVDEAGRPVGGLDLALGVRTEDSEWIVVQEIEKSHFRTDPAGTAIVPWAPRERLKYLDVKTVGPDWKVDEIDRGRISDGMTTVHVRREHEVRGRLVMPDGANPEGILVTGFGFGPKHRGSIPHARAGRDGVFTLRVPAEHGFVLGLSDRQWASDAWSGLILDRESGRPAEIRMDVYPATPVTIRVTRGPKHEPIVDTWVEASGLGQVKWVDAKGEERSGSGGGHVWLKTDPDGLARAGFGKGRHRVRVSSGIWDEEREIRVTSDQPVAVEFHRPWVDDRRVSGKLMLGGSPYEPSPSLVARAWTPQPPRFPIEHEPKVLPDGSFEVAFDAVSLSLLFIDREKQRAGFAQPGPEEAAASVNMEPTATYGGTLQDEDDRPMANRSLQLFVKNSSYEAVAARRTDRSGRFRFEGVAAKVPLQLTISNEADEPEYFLFDGDRLFRPGEVREDDRVRPRRASSSATAARPTIPLADRVANLGRDVRSSGLRVLVALEGDRSQGVVQAVDHLLDDERTRAVLGYLPIRVEFDSLKLEGATLAGSGWPLPGPGEIVLVALDGDRKTIATRRLSPTTEALGAAFLDEHRPAARDARKLLAEARNDARATGRRVWLVHGGPRCAPCFRLASWMEDHHDSLAKDFVTVKLMEGVDDGVVEVFADIPAKPGDGIPWFAITEPDGMVLTTSSGPLGNIGFPSSVEGLRHLRQMLERTALRLTPHELDQLIASLKLGR